MAPVLKSVHNISGKHVHVNIDGRSFDIDHDESQPIGVSMPTEGYTKIDRVNSEDVQGYRLRYDDYNIMINDALGKENGIADNAIHTKYASKEVRITILKDEIVLSGTGLGIYDSHGNPVFYVSVVARHVAGGGITVVAGETSLVGGEEVEVEDASA